MNSLDDATHTRIQKFFRIPFPILFPTLWNYTCNLTWQDLELGASVLDGYDATMSINEARPCAANAWACMSAGANFNYGHEGRQT
jgi:hypothetical protein